MSANGDDVPNELYYLEKDFAPRSLKIYQLKAILKTHKIKVASNARKADLIKLFQEHVESQRDTILAEYRTQQEQRDKEREVEQQNLGRGRRVPTPSRRVLETALKQTNGDDAAEASAKHKDEPANGQTPPLKDKDGFAIPELPTRKRSVTPTASEEIKHESTFTAQDSFASSDEDDQLAMKLKNASKKRTASSRQQRTSPTAPPSRTFTAQDSFASSDEDSDVPGKVQQLRERRTAKTANPVLIRRSSPPPPPSPSSTTEAAPQKPKKLPRTTGKENGHQQENAESDQEYNADSSDNEDDEQELESMGPVDLDEVTWLVEDNALHEAHILGKSRAEWTTILRWLIKAYLGLVCLTALATALVVSTRAYNGYCDSERSDDLSEEGGSLGLPTSCIPCPDHGVCSSGVLACPPLYHRQRPWYNSHGLLPLADACVRDSAMGRAIDSTEKTIKQVLARAQGKAVCNQVHMGGKLDDSPVVRISGTELFDTVSTTDFADEEDTEHVKLIVSNAIKQAIQDPMVHYWDIDGLPYYGTDHVALPLWCSAATTLSRIPHRIRSIAAGVIVALSTLLYVYCKIQQERRIKQRTRAKVDKILIALQEQLKKSKDDPQAHDRGIPVSQLRVQVSAGRVNHGDETSDWLRVVHTVNKHPQVRRGHREIAGELCEVWELTL